MSNALVIMRNAVTSRGARQLLKVQKSSPTLLFGVGVVGVVGTAIYASKATLQLRDILDDHEKLVFEREQHLADQEDVKAPSYTESDLEHDTRVLKLHLVGDIAKLYSPAIGLGVLSIGALTGSHVILNKRQTSLMAAYAGLDKSYKAYRQRVVEAVGPEKEREIRTELEEFEVRDEVNGELKGKISIAKGKHSPYARMFSVSTSTGWNPNPGYNPHFLRVQQQHANDMLRMKGHVFLNEVYDILGLDRTKQGAIVGWVKDGKGDNFVEFGIEDYIANYNDLPQNMRAMTEDAVWLDFNVDGVIYNLI